MANRVTAPELERFVVVDVKLTGVSLGAGAYGSVEEVEIPGARVAAKKLHTQLINLGSPQQVHKWVTDFVEECKLMSQLHHPHIVRFLGVAYLPGSPIPVLLMEKLQTSLDNLLETSPNIPLDVKVHLLTGTAQGVVYLHSHTPPIAHRDLTARNILIDSGLTAKIADLGVARMVNVQPGQLAATMTAGPGNNLYMPPETVQEEGATRYNTAIDIFSFGVVSLFTLTQTFPKDLKPATYHDPRTRRIAGRSEVERREHYIQQMKAALGETHPLVKLTLDCLEYLPEDRPSAVEVLRRLEEVGRTVPLNFAESKLELIQKKPTIGLSSITFHWSHKDMAYMEAYNHQPVFLSNKLYIRGRNHRTTGAETVLEYTPNHDQWTELPPPPDFDYYFTIATVKGQLLVMGGCKDDGIGKPNNKILTFDKQSQQWVQSYPAMPKALSLPAATGYQDHLITAGGQVSSDYMPDVQILNTASNQWTTAQPLPKTDRYYTVLIQDTIYLVGQYTRAVLRAHVPTLISGAKSGVWETLPNAPYYHSSPVTIDNTLLTVGGRAEPDGLTTSIQMYTPDTGLWTKVGDLPELSYDYNSGVLSGKLYVVGTEYLYVAVL